jgi:tripartite-type tricarboxylate transporter receptor subunit TctC
VQFLFSDIASVAELIKDGKLRALGISTSKRFESAPEIPTLAETGIPGFDGDSWQMLVAPAKTPKEIVDKLNVAINEIMTSPEIRQQMIKLGMSPSGKGTPAELAAFVQSETTRWGKVVTDAGFAGSQ